LEYYCNNITHALASTLAQGINVSSKFKRCITIYCVATARTHKEVKQEICKTSKKQKN